MDTPIRLASAPHPSRTAVRAATFTRDETMAGRSDDRTADGGRRWPAWWWARSSLPILDGQVALPGPARAGRGPDRRARRAAGLCARPEDAWFRRRRASRARSAVADGALSPRDDRPAVRGAGRTDHRARSALSHARAARRGESRMGARRRRRCGTPWSVMPPGSTRHLASSGRRGSVRSSSRCSASRRAPWKPIDSLAVGRLLTWRLAENHQAELVRAALTAKFGAAMARRADAAAIRPTRRRFSAAERPSGRVASAHSDGRHAAIRDPSRELRAEAPARRSGRSRVAVGLGAPRQQQQLGAGRRQDEGGPADPRQRSASADRVPVGVVPDASGGGGTRRHRRDDPGRAVCRARLTTRGSRGA